jgi:hypothetical protein
MALPPSSARDGSNLERRVKYQISPTYPHLIHVQERFKMSSTYQNDYGNFTFSDMARIPEEVKVPPYKGKWLGAFRFFEDNLKNKGDVVRVECPSKKAYDSLKATIGNWNHLTSRRTPFKNGYMASIFLENGTGDQCYMWVELVEKKEKKDTATITVKAS